MKYNKVITHKLEMTDQELDAVLAGLMSIINDARPVNSSHHKDAARKIAATIEGPDEPY